MFWYYMRILVASILTDMKMSLVCLYGNKQNAVLTFRHLY